MVLEKASNNMQFYNNLFDISHTFLQISYILMKYKVVQYINQKFQNLSNNNRIPRELDAFVSPTLSINEIADKLCFDTPNYFSKTFKKIAKTILALSIPISLGSIIS